MRRSVKVCTRYTALRSEQRKQHTRCLANDMSPVVGTARNGYMSFTNPRSFPHKIRGIMRKNIGFARFSAFGDALRTWQKYQSESLGHFSHFGDSPSEQDGASHGRNLALSWTSLWRLRRLEYFSSLGIQSIIQNSMQTRRMPL